MRRSDYAALRSPTNHKGRVVGIAKLHVKIGTIGEICSRDSLHPLRIASDQPPLKHRARHARVTRHALGRLQVPVQLHHSLRPGFVVQP